MACAELVRQGDLQTPRCRRRRPRTGSASSRRRRRSTRRRRVEPVRGARVRVVRGAVAVEPVVADIGEVDVDAAVRPVVRRVQVGLRRPVAVCDDLLRPHDFELGAHGLDVIGQPVGVGVDRVRRVRRRGHVMDAPVGGAVRSRLGRGVRGPARIRVVGRAREKPRERPPARPGKAGAAARRGRGARASRHAVPVPARSRTGRARRRAGRAREHARARTAPRSARPRRGHA